MLRPAPLAPLLLLAACGGAGNSAPVDNAAVASPVAGAATPVATQAVVPTPTKLRVFGDWTAGCDNGDLCQAGALMTDDSPAPPVLLSIRRAAGPGGAITVRFQIDGDPPVLLPLVFAIDGRTVGRGGTELTGDAAATMVAELAKGRTLAIAAASGQLVGTVSLTGAAAALRWIDSEQGRAGTTGAIIARGDDADTRPAPALPIVRAATIRGEAALLDPQLVTTMRRMAGCEGDGSDLPDQDASPLGGGRTLVLVPCLTGAYNIVSAVFVVEDGKATPAGFDAPSAMPGDVPGIQQVVNARFADGVLTSDAKGRGLGDCGVRQRFAWDGTRFRLIEQDEMEECRGNIDYIRTWTARLVR